MANLLSRIAGPIAIASGTSTVFTGATAHRYTVRGITITNNTVAAINIKLGINGVADINLILPQSSIDAGGFATFDGVLVLVDTDALIAVAGTSGLTITLSGVDQA